ncbi:MAG: hypothetical protein JXR14_07980 [Paracoccaceae bacterium]
MRAVTLGDLVQTARCLEPVTPARRCAVARQWIREAHAADKCRKRLGRSHALWGNGALSMRLGGRWARSSLNPARQGFRDSLAAVLEALEAETAMRGRGAREVSRVRRSNRWAGSGQT